MTGSKFLITAALLIVLTLTPLQAMASSGEEAAPEAATEAPVTTLSGTGNHGSADGDRLASFNLPNGITGGGNNIYIADTYNNLIRVYSGTTGKVETLAGQVLKKDVNRFPSGGYADGKPTEALFNRPFGIVRDNFLGRLYVTDSANNVIRAVDNAARASNSVRVTTYSGGEAGYADGHVTEARFNCPTGITMDNYKNIYVADTLNNVIRKIDVKGIVTTIAGVPNSSGLEDGPAAKALFNAPTGIAVSPDGSAVYVADTGNQRIRRISAGSVTTYAGTTDRIDQDGEPWGDFLDGEKEKAMFSAPVGLALCEDGLIVADSGNNLIRLITNKEVITLAGTGEPGPANGPALEATFNTPSDVFVQDDILYIVDTGNNQIRKMELTGGSNE